VPASSSLFGLGEVAVGGGGSRGGGGTDMEKKQDQDICLAQVETQWRSEIRDFGVAVAALVSLGSSESES
jgi:hypothetical protein